MRLFKDVVGKGTYATVANAEKRMAAVNEQFGEDFRYIIMATEDGRFAPVVVVTRDQQYLVGALAQNGICVTF